MNYILIGIGCFIFVIIIIGFKSYHLPSLTRKAEELMDQGDYSSATVIIKRILEKKSEYVPARYLKAKILKLQGQYLLSISEFNNLLLIPDFKKIINELDVHNFLAELYNLTHNFPKEIDEYRIILVLNPEDINANYRIGHAFYKKREYKRAVEHLIKAFTSNPGLVDSIFPIGVSYFKIEEYDNSEQYLLKAVMNIGNNIEAQFYLGLIYKMKKDFDNAIAMLENAKSDKGLFINSLYNLGEIFFERNQYKHGIKCMEEGLNQLNDKNEDSIKYRYLLAEFYEKENLINEAVHHWEKIDAASPAYRNTSMKLKSYKEVFENKTLTSIFSISLEELQPLLAEMISNMNFNVINKKIINPNEFQYKAYNIKRINEPPTLIYFNRTTKEITEVQINEFNKMVLVEKCKLGIYITTSKYSLKAKSSSVPKLIELYDSNFVISAVEKIYARKKK